MKHLPTDVVGSCLQSTFPPKTCRKMLLGQMMSQSRMSLTNFLNDVDSPVQPQEGLDSMQ